MTDNQLPYNKTETIICTNCSRDTDMLVLNGEPCEDEIPDNGICILCYVEIYGKTPWDNRKYIHS